MSLFRFFFAAVLLIVAASLHSDHAAAHPISISDAYVELKEDRLEVRLEVFVEDLFLFHELKLTEQNSLPLDEVHRGATLHQDFLQQRFKILTADGNRLSLEFRGINKADLPAHDIPFGHLMFFRLMYSFDVPLASAPEYLTFIQNFTEENVALPAEVQVKVKPLRGRRFQQVILPNQPWTIHLDDTSADEQTAEPSSPLERFEKLRQQTLGITSYGETYAFLYIEPEEYRLEVLIPLATLSASLEQPLPPDGILDVAEQQQLRQPLSELFANNVRLRTNGQLQPAVVDRVDYFGVTFRDFSRIAEPAPVSIANARVGVILHVNRDRQNLPADTQLEWTLFNQYLYQVRVVVIEGNRTARVMLRQVEGHNIKNLAEVLATPAENSASEQDAAAASGGDTTSSTAALHESDSPASGDVLTVQLPPSITAREYVLACFLGLLLLVAVVDSARFLARRRSGVEMSESEPLGKVPGRLRRRAWFWAISAAGLASLLLMFAVTSIGLPRSDVLPSESRVVIAQSLLGQTYAAFNQRKETEILDRLEQSLDGPLLRELYLEIRRSMTIEEQGGALARAGQVTLEECETAKLPDRFAAQEPFARALRCRWEVPGTVEHWGHIHRRTTAYEALLTLAPRPLDRQQAGQEPRQDTPTSTAHYAWKLIGVDLIDQNQSVLETSVRTF